MAMPSLVSRIIASGAEAEAKTAREALQKAFVSAWKRTPKIGDEIKFIRYGTPVEKSVNHATGLTEDGMSVYSLSKTGAAEQTVRSEFSDRATAFVGKGKVSGYGSDGEPLVTEISELKKASKQALDKADFYGVGKDKWMDALGYDKISNAHIAHPITEETARMNKYIPATMGLVGVGAIGANAAQTSGSTWSGKYTNGESFSGLSDAEMEQFQDHIDPTSAKEDAVAPIDLVSLKNKAGSVGYSGLEPAEQATLDRAYQNSSAAKGGLSLETVRMAMDAMAQGAGARDFAAEQAQAREPIEATLGEQLAPTSAANRTLQEAKGFLGQEQGGLGATIGAGLSDIARVPGAAIGAAIGGTWGGMKGALEQLVSNVKDGADPISGMIPAAWEGASTAAQRAYADPTGMFGSPSSALAFASEVPLIAKVMSIPGTLISNAMQAAPKAGAILASSANASTAATVASLADQLGSRPDAGYISPSIGSAALGGAIGGAGGMLSQFALNRVPGVESYIEKAANKGTSAKAKMRLRDYARQNIADVIDEANAHSRIGTGADIMAVGQRAGDASSEAYQAIDRAIAPRTTAFGESRAGNVVLHPDSPNYGHATPPTETALRLIRMAPEHLDELAGTQGLAQSVRESLVGHGVAAGEDLVWVPPKGAELHFNQALQDLRSLTEHDPSRMFEGAHIAVRGAGKYANHPAASVSDLHKLAQRKVYADRAWNGASYSAGPSEIDKALLKKFTDATTQYQSGASLGQSGEMPPMLWSDLPALRKSFNLHQGTKLRFGAANMQSDINRAGGDVISKYMYKNNQSITDAGLQDVAQLGRMSYAKRKLVEGLMEEAAKTKLAKSFSEMAANELPASWRFATPMMARRLGNYLATPGSGVLSESLMRTTRKDHK